MHLKILFAVLAIFVISCETTAPHYNLCSLINNDKDPLYFYCESTDVEKDPYSIWATQAAEESYLGMPLDDYREIVKYIKQVQKDLERCKK